MKDYKNEFIEKVNQNYGDNAKYILNAMKNDLDMYDFYQKRGKDDDWFKFIVENNLEKAEKINKYMLTPATAKVGDGATINLYSDRHACTIIKVTKSTVTVQRDKAALSHDFKPEFIVGGFAAHCTNQNKQEYTYERDENGEIETFHWSNKYNRYGTPGNCSLSAGRHEFYDYNF